MKEGHIRRTDFRLDQQLIFARDNFQNVLTWLNYPAQSVNANIFNRAIRAAEICNKLPHTPIYALTAMSSFDAAEDCKDAGIDACLTKPIATDALRQILACCTRNKEIAC